MDEPLMCGDFNLQDFIVSRPKKGPHFDELEGLVKSKFENHVLMESADLELLRSSWLKQKYPQISLSFLGLTTNHHANKGYIALPRFSICHHKKNVFEIELVYKIQKHLGAFTIKNVGVDVTFSIKNSIPELASYNILNGLFFPFEKDINLKNGHALVPTCREKELKKMHSMDCMYYIFKTYLNCLKPQSIEDKIKEASICNDNIYFIYMNKPEDYNASAYSRYMNNNILTIIQHGVETFALGSFNPLPLEKYLLQEGVKQ